MKRRFGWLTAAAYVALAVFAGLDAAAHFTKYQHGETVSASWWQAEKAVPALRIAALIGAAVLGSHLAFQIP